MFSFSQNKTDSLNLALNDYRQANAWYKKALEGDQETLTGDEHESRYNRFALEKFRSAERFLPDGYDSLRFFLSLKAGELAHYFDSLGLALHYYGQAILLKKANVADSFLFRPFLFSGHIYFGQNQLAMAASSFRKAEEILNKYQGKISEGQRLYNDLGVMYFQGGNYLQAGNYFRKAGELLERGNPYFADFYVNYQINYGISISKLEDYEKASAILKALIPYKKHLNEIYNNLGLISASQGSFRDALKYYQTVNYRSALDIGLDNDKAAAWLGWKVYDSARFFLNAARSKYIANGGKNISLDYGNTLKIFGDLEALTGSQEKAIDFYQQAIRHFYPSFKPATVQENPMVFTGVFSYLNLFKTLVAKAAAYHSLYLNSHGISQAKEELQTFLAAFKLLDYIEKVYDSDEARLFLEKSKYFIHEKPIDLAFEIYRKTHDATYLEIAYELDQKSKASVLAFNSQRNQSMQPDSPVRYREQLLKQQITRLSIAAAESKDPASIKNYNSQISGFEIKLGKTQDSLAAMYPSANVVSIPTIASIQKDFLDPQTMLISYHFGKTGMSIFTVTSAHFNAIQKQIYPEFKDDLTGYIQQLKQPSEQGFSSISLSRLSNFLLHDILDPVHHRLIFIPDDDLNYIPFESLNTGGKYLIEAYSVQYQYSTSLLKKETADFVHATTLSFAPFTDRNYKDSIMNMDRLANSHRELQGLRGSSFLGSAATKQNFLDNMHGREIIHLATHAIVNDSNERASYIVFAPWHAKDRSDYLLYGAEIYNLSMSDNKLIILSACETGYGNLVKGEGLMSLSRAFGYAGCPDIITSLWKADDLSTAFIAQGVHRYLQKGFPVDRALQQSKKDYLNDRAINPRRKQPAYWANMVFIGNYQPASEDHGWLWIVGLVIISGAILLFLRLRGLSPGRDTDALHWPGSA